MQGGPREEFYGCGAVKTECRLMKRLWAREAQDDMEEIDKERLP